MKVQAELDETKIILHKTIESVLERGEKLENLVDRSEALNMQSKMFYKTARKQVSLGIRVLIEELLLYCYVGFWMHCGWVQLVG
jgi:Synaptobrevin